MPFKKNPPYYHVWAGMKDRCYNPRNKQYADYGGRGISVCEEWRTSYKAFASDMGERPLGHSLDRIDNDGNYEPGNCRWASRRTQQMNQRRAVYVTIDGTRYRAIELSEQYGLKTDTIIKRAADGLTFADVVSPEPRRNLNGLAAGGMASGAKKRQMTHCKRGHEFTEENTRITPQGWRACRTCHNEKMRRLVAKKAAARMNEPLNCS